MSEYSNEKENILVRLRKIEGQIKGIQKMIENEKSCNEVLTQIAAARSALNKVGTIILEKYSKACLSEFKETQEQKNVDELVETLIRFIK
ncbi:metal-sensitive transcriptional regulator [Caldicellulosiruptoraceae bacterium PP1]